MATAPRRPQRPPGMPAEQPRPERKNPAQALLEASPWMPPAYEIADASAFQALVRGDADKDQQQRAVRWLVHQGCGTYDMSYRPGPGGERDTAFAEGRRFVGLQVVKLLNLNIAKLRRSEPLADAHEPKS